MSRRIPGRGSLTRSLVLLAVTVAALAVALTGLIAWQSAETGAEQREREALARQATVLSRLPGLSGLIFDRAQALGGPNGEELAVVAPDGTVSGTATPALDTASKAALLAGRPVSVTGILAGRKVLLVGQPDVRGGAVVLTEPYAVVDRITSGIRRNTLLPLVIGMLGAALAGTLLARRTARPLRAAAAVAHRLAEGERAVLLPAVVPLDGPGEAAEIGRALTVLDAALAHSENRQREFLLSVSHELRTPLTAVQGYAEALADDLIEPGRLPEVGRTLAEETRRLDRLLGDLLALARLEADDFRLDLAAADLAAVAGEAARFWTEPCAREGVELRYEPPGTAGLELRTDAFRVRQLIDGLLQNALRAAPDGGCVVLALRPAPGGAVLIEVRDSGPGLTEDDVRIAFDSGALHARYRGARPVGTGLGLAIAHRLTTRLGGTVTAHPHGPEGGARFTVTLPA